MELLGCLVGWLIAVHVYILRSGKNRNAVFIHERKNCDGCKKTGEGFRNTHKHSTGSLTTTCVPGKTS